MTNHLSIEKFILTNLFAFLSQLQNKMQAISDKGKPLFRHVNNLRLLFIGVIDSIGSAAALFCQTARIPSKKKEAIDCFRSAEAINSLLLLLLSYSRYCTREGLFPLEIHPS